jgi:tetratricopeptide (TPR) repeat protein
MAADIRESSARSNSTSQIELNQLPESSDAYDSLGEAYMKAGQKQAAIDSYKKSLEKDPGNDNAKQKLKELENNTLVVK